MDDAAQDAGGCCGGGHACAFAKALLARTASCELAHRQSLGERELLQCRSPVALVNCRTLAALLHERSRFALRLPAAGRPLMHVHALKLQCGGLAGVRHALGSQTQDVHALVREAQQAHGSLADLPWRQVVATVVAWQPRRRS